jgi:glutamyl-tRNA reductase
LRELRESAGLAEALVLSTCNRVEVFGALPRSSDAHEDDLTRAAGRVRERLAARGGPEVARALATATGPDALRHLFRVASSLDSLVVGEPQILGQLKDAIATATDLGTVGSTLGRALRRALHVGKRVRTETQIGAGQVSISSVAVDLAVQIFGSLEGRRALLVGAGEMAEGAAKLLVKAGAELTVVNRSRERAERLASDVGGKPREWGELNWCLIDADIVITSTSSPAFVVTADAIKTARKARRGRSLFVIDIAVPRDVDPRIGELDGVYLYDIDDLEQIVSESVAGRASEAARASAIVEDEVRAFEHWRAELAMSPVVVGLRARVRATLVSELERSLAGKLKHLGLAEREALLVMVDAATNKLCHRPTTRLRELASEPLGAELAEALGDLFDLPRSPSDDDARLGSIPPAPPSTRDDRPAPRRRDAS